MKMIEVGSLDQQIASLTQWIIVAGKGLIGFYNNEKGVFWRDTFGKTEKDERAHPTSTSRAFFSLYEYLRFILEEDRNDLFDEVRAILKGVAEKYFIKLIDEPEFVRKPRYNEENMFTDSQLLIALSLLENLQRVVQIDTDIFAIKNAAKKIADQRSNELRTWKGGKAHNRDEVYDFVTLYVVRALDAFSREKFNEDPIYTQELRTRVKEDVLRLLAFHFSGVSSKFDPAELTFSISLLNHFPTPDVPLLTETAVRTIVEAQAQDGGWPTARPISYEGHGFLQVASFEIALALTQLLIRKIYESDERLFEIVLPTLSRTFELVKSHFNTIDEDAGWANDHTRRTGLIQSWTTAIVLTFLIHYRDALVLLRQYLVLKQYIPTYRFQLPNVQIWPDMIPAFRQPNWIDLNKLDSISDPSDNAAVTKALKNEVVKPISNSWIHRPQKSSFIFYGPPGTRKTSLAIRIAEALNWPLLILSPPYFLRKGGLEGIESCAAEIFDDLFHLRRVVVLFDECEDFFKARPKESQIENRTIGAFLTAGMLPRLQALHDKKWVIFILATNSDLSNLDEAVRRPGRFDYAQNIGAPTLNAQIRYVKSKMPSDLRSVTDPIETVLMQYEKMHSTGPGVPLVSFYILDKLMEKVKTGLDEPTLKNVTDFLKDLLDQKGPPPLE